MLRIESMKSLKIIFALTLTILLAGSAMSQNLGELERFNNDQLERVNEVRLFPNPTVDFLYIKIANSNLKDVKFTVHNIIGNVIEVELEKLEDNSYRIKVEDLPTGYYLLAIRNDDQYFKETYKFLKK